MHNAEVVDYFALQNANSNLWYCVYLYLYNIFTTVQYCFSSTKESSLKNLYYYNLCKNCSDYYYEVAKHQYFVQYTL